MANTSGQKIYKPGFLLIEIMCAFLLLIVAGTIMSFYVAQSQKRQKTAQNRLQAFLAVDKALEQMRAGDASFAVGGRFDVNASQIPLILEWDDGMRDQIWLAQAQATWHQTESICLQTILGTKAV